MNAIEAYYVWWVIVREVQKAAECGASSTRMLFAAVSAVVTLIFKWTISSSVSILLPASVAEPLVRTTCDCGLARMLYILQENWEGQVQYFSPGTCRRVLRIRALCSVVGSGHSAVQLCCGRWIRLRDVVVLWYSLFFSLCSRWTHNAFHFEVTDASELREFLQGIAHYVFVKWSAFNDPLQRSREDCRCHFKAAFA